MSYRFHANILAALLGLLTLSNLCHAELKPINPAELQTLIDQGITVIDIRRPEEWQQSGIIPGSKLLTFFDRQGRYDTEQWLHTFRQWVNNRAQPFVLVCRSGKRTGRAGQLLADKISLAQAYHLQGGITAWQREHREVVFPE